MQSLPLTLPLIRYNSGDYNLYCRKQFNFAATKTRNPSSVSNGLQNINFSFSYFSCNILNIVSQIFDMYLFPWTCRWVHKIVIVFIIVLPTGKHFTFPVEDISTSGSAPAHASLGSVPPLSFETSLKFYSDNLNNHNFSFAIPLTAFMSVAFYGS